MLVSVHRVVVTEDPAGASLTLATEIVNESVTDSVASETVMTTLWSPISASPGVPVSAPVVASKAIQLGTVVPAMVRESPSSSAPVTVYVYAASSVAEVTAVLEMVGASLVLATLMVNVSVAVAPAASVAVITTELEPTSPLAGVPASTPVDAVKVSQLGTVVPLRVIVSPLSTSAAVTVYVYAASSVAEVTAVLVMVGASLVLATVMVNESVADAPAASVAVMTTL